MRRFSVARAGGFDNKGSIGLVIIGILGGIISIGGMLLSAYLFMYTIKSGAGVSLLTIQAAIAFCFFILLGEGILLRKRLTWCIYSILIPYFPFLFLFLPTHTIFGVFPYIVFVLYVGALALTIFLGLKSAIKFGFRSYSKTNYKDIEVSFLLRLNGGGVIAANEFVGFVSKKIGKVGHVFEYCAGPGFIGFALLANNLCDRLTLADVNPKAIEAIKETIKNNNLQDRVNVYHSDCLDAIPETEQWDLVVGNPPWELCPKSKKLKKGHIRLDPGYQVHEKFYKDIHKYLKPDGSILFIESRVFTDADSFKDMIEKNGLRIIESFNSVPLSGIFKNMNDYEGLKRTFVIAARYMLFASGIYFIWSKKIGSRVNQALESR